MTCCTTQCNFDPTYFRQLYPNKFLDVSMPMLSIIWDNVVGNIVSCPGDGCIPIGAILAMRYLLMGHFLALQERGDTTAGQLISASEGSVSAGFKALESANPDDSFYLQTTYGQTFLQIARNFKIGFLIQGDSECEYYGNVIP